MDESNSIRVIFRTPQPILFSALIEKKMGLTLTWTKWRPKELELREDATLWVRDPSLDNSYTYASSLDSDSHITKLGNLTAALTNTITSPLQTLSPGLAAVESYNVSKVTLTQMNHKALEGNGTDRDYGILLDLQTSDGHDTKIRFILTELQFEDFTVALNLVAKEHNLDSVRQLSITDHVQAHSNKNPTRHRIVSTARKNASTMRITIAMAMDSMDTHSKVEQVVAKRGVFKWMPVYFSNDLVHGAWWFVIASIVFTVSSAIVLDNSYKNYYLGEDDSFLDRFRYRASWVLMTVSGAFFTLGSFAFVRATHYDPPMKPLFQDYYHVQNDELLGSWLFFLGTAPVVPYIVLYLEQSHGAFIYWVALAIASVFVFATYLFVRACYPNDNENAKRWQIIKPITRGLICCFCSQQFLDKHLPNDWLAGNWIFFWGLFVGSVLSVLLFIYSLAIGDGLMIFILGCSLFEMVGYTIGSAYWTAGSYPECPDDFDDNDHHDNDNNDQSDTSSTPRGAPPLPHQNTTAQGLNLGYSTTSQLTPSLLTWFLRPSVSGGRSQATANSDTHVSSHPAATSSSPSPSRMSGSTNYSGATQTTTTTQLEKSDLEKNLVAEAFHHDDDVYYNPHLSDDTGGGAVEVTKKSKTAVNVPPLKQPLL